MGITLERTYLPESTKTSRQRFFSGYLIRKFPDGLNFLQDLGQCILEDGVVIGVDQFVVVDMLRVEGGQFPPHFNRDDFVTRAVDDGDGRR